MTPPAVPATPPTKPPMIAPGIAPTPSKKAPLVAPAITPLTAPLTNPNRAAARTLCCGEVLHASRISFCLIVVLVVGVGLLGALEAPPPPPVLCGPEGCGPGDCEPQPGTIQQGHAMHPSVPWAAQLLFPMLLQPLASGSVVQLGSFSGTDGKYPNTSPRPKRPISQTTPRKNATLIS
jgi:hypothetical protein